MTREEWLENFARKLMLREDLEYSQAIEIAEHEADETGFEEDPKEDGDDN